MYMYLQFFVVLLIVFFLAQQGHGIKPPVILNYMYYSQQGKTQEQATIICLNQALGIVAILNYGACDFLRISSECSVRGRTNEGGSKFNGFHAGSC